MSVTFQISALITATKDALSVHAKADAEYQAACAAYRAERESDQDKLAQIRELRDELSAFLKTRRQPERADAQRFKKAAREDYLSNLYVTGFSDSDVRNNVSRPAGWLNANTAASWAGLIRMLEAHTEDTITANQLKLFGYDKLEPLFRSAALASKVTDR